MQRPFYRQAREIMVPAFVGHIFRTHRLGLDGGCSSYWNCNICDGGLLDCIVCELAEGALTSECPGVPSGHLIDKVYSGEIDFKDGFWRATGVKP